MSDPQVVWCIAYDEVPGLYISDVYQTLELAKTHYHDGEWRQQGDDWLDESGTVWIVAKMVKTERDEAEEC